MATTILDKQAQQRAAQLQDYEFYGRFPTIEQLGDRLLEDEYQAGELSFYSIRNLDSRTPVYSLVKKGALVYFEDDGGFWAFMTPAVTGEDDEGEA